MGRHVVAVSVGAAVALADTGLLVAIHADAVTWWAVAAYALAAAAVVALRFRQPPAAFALALVLGTLTGASYLLMLWAAYQVGRSLVSRVDLAVVAGATVGAVTLQVLTREPATRSVSSVATVFVVFVVLPLLVGRYLTQHERLVSALAQRRGQLRRRRELLLEQERLRERLRIARDMHDSLGHRLSLVSVQAAALEVADLPPGQQQAIGHLARTARSAMDELYDLIGALRGADESRAPGLDRVGEVVSLSRAAGMAVTVRQRGAARALAVDAGPAAYRVVEEGLTNAAKHAPGQPVTVSLDWEPDALLLTVANPVPGGPGQSGAEAGHGLSGLSERIRLVGGLLEHRTSAEGFRLLAMFPAEASPSGPAPVGDDTDDDLDAFDPPEVGRIRTVAIGAVVAVLVLLVLPASMLVGVR